jgi:sigma-B regulation protein RsbU (phosphoserine phosphatase)
MKAISDCRVLLVDDARENLAILVEALKRECKLSVATDGETALKIAEHTTPDLVLLDIMMPGMDGYEVCRRLRKSPLTAEVPIVFLSALDEAKNKARGFEAGGNDYVTKPFEILEVQARVRALLKAKAYNDAVKEQLAADLRVAREIQEGMITRDFRPMETQYPVEFTGVLEPAREVGGDLFGAFAVEGGRLVLVMGDVSGKGIPASLFMVRTGTLVRVLARQIQEPERILQALNNELASDNPSGMFVTLVCGIFEPATGRLALANAGQTQPVLIRTGSKPALALPALGTALGLEPDLEFERVELTLNPSDTIVFYTDGVTEAMDHSSECYGSARLLQILNGDTAPKTRALADRILGDVRKFADGAPQSDDIALLLMRVAEPKAPSRTSARVKLTLQAVPAEVMRAVAALEEFCGHLRLAQRETFGLCLALEEMASNVVNHAYKRNERESFDVSFEHIEGRISIEIRDHGPAFDPCSAAPPQVNLDSDDLEKGGVGICLARHYLDEIVYQRDAGENVLRMTKTISPQP